MVCKTAHLVLILYDDFNGKCIKNGGQVFTINGRILAPILKPEGFYVFTGPADPVETVTITGGQYVPVTIRVDGHTLDPSFPVMHIRLMRKPHAGFPDCEYLEGYARPGCTVYALKQGQTENRLLAMHETPDGTAVAFSGYFPEPAEYTRFMIGTGAEQELLLTGEYLAQEKTYLLAEKLQRTHSPGEPVVRAWAAQCGTDGFYSIPVEKGQIEKIEQLLFYDKEAKQWDCLSVTAHK